MARSPRNATAVEEPTQPTIEEPGAAEQPAPTERPPQGIVVRLMETGDPKKDFHKKHRTIRMIDPKSLIVDGLEPALALPIPGTTQRRIRRVTAEIAAEMLTCDFVTGNAPAVRLATDAEVEAADAAAEVRAKNKGINPPPKR